MLAVLNVFEINLNLQLCILYLFITEMVFNQRRSSIEFCFPLSLFPLVVKLASNLPTYIFFFLNLLKLFYLLDNLHANLKKRPFMQTSRICINQTMPRPSLYRLVSRLAQIVALHRFLSTGSLV